MRPRLPICEPHVVPGRRLFGIPVQRNSKGVAALGGHRSIRGQRQRLAVSRVDAGDRIVELYQPLISGNCGSEVAHRHEGSGQ